MANVFVPSSLKCRRCRLLPVSPSYIFRFATVKSHPLLRAGYVTGCIQQILREIDPLYLRVLFIFLLSGGPMPTIELPSPRAFPALSRVSLSGVILLSPQGHDHDGSPLAPNLTDMQILRLAADLPPKLNLANEITCIAPSLRQLKLSVLPSPYSAALLIPPLKTLAPPQLSQPAPPTPPHPRITLAFDPFYVPPPRGETSPRLSPVFEADPVGTYRAGVALFSTLRRTPVVIEPPPEMKGIEVLREDERRRREAFWEDWVGFC